MVLSNAYIVYMYAMLSYTSSQPSYLGILAWYDGFLRFVGDIMVKQSIWNPCKSNRALLFPPLQPCFCWMLISLLSWHFGLVWWIVEILWWHNGEIVNFESMEVNLSPSSSTLASMFMLIVYEVYMYVLLSSTASRPSYLCILFWHDGLLRFLVT
jgi:hypothetical protein